MKRIAWILLLSAAAATVARAADPPLVIAHRGASGHLPEHTMESKVMAYMAGADYIEQDVVLTRDDQPVVLHDIYLDAVTDVANRFPGRAREDGRHYVVDFSLEEIRTLRVHERVRVDSGEARFPGRFPPDLAFFRIHTLDEELALIRALDAQFGRETGIYAELKDPAWHEAAGKDIAGVVLASLERHGYVTREDRAYLQSFDHDTLSRLAREERTRLPLVQLLADERWWPGSRTDHGFLRTREGLARIAEYADGIGVWLGHLYEGADTDGNPRLTSLANDAKTRGLEVHVYTLRADALPEGIGNFEALLSLVYETLEADGAFTDFPGIVRRFVDGMR